MGFEPTTTGITIRDSNQLSYSHHIKNFSTLGTPDRNRTCNRPLRRRVLYPVELRALYLNFLSQPISGYFGRGGGIRTHDPLLPKQMR